MISEWSTRQWTAGFPFARQNQSVAKGGKHILLDLSDYLSREGALELAAYGCPRAYTQIAKKHLESAKYATEGSLLFSSVVSRMRGLHEGIVREIMANNPHAVLPLIRAWVEVITITMYLLRNPRYIDFVLHGPGDGRPRKKSFEAMFHAVKDDAEQLRVVYGQLSDYSHFGLLGVWNAHSIEDDEQGIVSWTDAPRWRDENHFRIACAHAHELAVAGQHYLDELGGLLVPASAASDPPLADYQSASGPNPQQT